jgi:guanylate kinase
MATAKVMTSIYLTPAQKRTLASRARQHRTTVSEEIRSTLDRHFKECGTDDASQLSVLAAEANKAIDRMISKLDETHATVVQLCKSMTRRKP